MDPGDGGGGVEDGWRWSAGPGAGESGRTGSGRITARPPSPPGFLQRGDTFLGNDLQRAVGQKHGDGFSGFGAGNVRWARNQDAPAIFQSEREGTEGLTFGPVLQVIEHGLHVMKLRAALRVFQRISCAAASPEDARIRWAGGNQVSAKGSGRET